MREREREKDFFTKRGNEKIRSERGECESVRQSGGRGHAGILATRVFLQPPLKKTVAAGYSTIEVRQRMSYR